MAHMIPYTDFSCFFPSPKKTVWWQSRIWI